MSANSQYILELIVEALYHEIFLRNFNLCTATLESQVVVRAIQTAVALARRKMLIKISG